MLTVEFSVVWMTSVGTVCCLTSPKNALAATAADGQAKTSPYSQQNDIDHVTHPYSISAI